MQLGDGATRVCRLWGANVETAIRTPGSGIGSPKLTSRLPVRAPSTLEHPRNVLIKGFLSATPLPSSPTPAPRRRWQPGLLGAHLRRLPPRVRGHLQPPGRHADGAGGELLQPHAQGARGGGGGGRRNGAGWGRRSVACGSEGCRASCTDGLGAPVPAVRRGSVAQRSPNRSCWGKIWWRLARRRHPGVAPCCCRPAPPQPPAPRVTPP